VIAAIKAPGTSAPIKLTKPQKRRLLEVVAGWLNEVGVPDLPEGAFELRNALVDERDAGELDNEG
jgi:hypothetical protein